MGEYRRIPRILLKARKETMDRAYAEESSRVSAWLDDTENMSLFTAWQEQKQIRVNRGI